jgi:acetylornithine/succinyldiaminopimelate/putrescine aminotransferase
MSEWSVGGVGGNVHAASFQGAALNMARILNLPGEVIDHFMQQHKELTSPFPLVEGIKGQGFAVAEASRGQAFSPSAGNGISSGRDGVSLA